MSSCATRRHAAQDNVLGELLTNTAELSRTLMDVDELLQKGPTLLDEVSLHDYTRNMPTATSRLRSYHDFFESTSCRRRFKG